MRGAISTSTEEGYGRVYDARVMRRLWPFAARYKVSLLLAVACMLGSLGSSLLAPYLVKLGIDGAVARGDAARLTLVVLLYLGNAAAGWLLQYGQTLLATRTAQRVLLDLRRALFDHLLRLDLGFYQRHAVGQLMSRVHNDVGTLQDLFSGGLLTTVADLVLLGGIVAVLFALQPRLALFTCAALPAAGLLTALWRPRSRRAFQRVRARLAQVNAHLQEAIAGVRVVQGLACEAATQRRFAQVNEGYLASNLHAARLTALLFPGMELLSGLTVALLVVAGGTLVLERHLSAGGLVAFVLYAYRVFDPLRDLSFRWNYLQLAMASGERIVALLDTPAGVPEARRPVVLPRLRGEVAFHRVSFHYRPGVPVLQDVSLHVPAGQCVALVGRTGAGKTTLVHLLARFYDVTSGAITLDGVDVRQLSRACLRRQLVLVPQEPFLFSGTVRDNLRFGRPGARDAELEAAARALGVHELIERLPQGYDTPVHERGVRLSQGQRQLLCLVRALLADPRLLLLDEATASLDAESERLVRQALAALRRGRTTFVIAHRLATVQLADRIVVLDQGRVVEDGTHAELLQRQGLYAQLYARSLLVS
ncbi:MAG: lipid A ABC transporter permease/ATP-binding protein [Candidatus Tectimicrobiota bacterium]|nr:MAG: lipid A ABC transporter permease/ATP-binding protein [Candidatus Tectomicrobia bacterium]